MVFQTTLSADLGAADLVVHVTDNTNARTTYPWRAMIANESVHVTGGVSEGLDWDISRGQDGTEPIEHLAPEPLIAYLGTLSDVLAAGNHTGESIIIYLDALSAIGSPLGNASLTLDDTTGVLLSATGANIIINPADGSILIGFVDGNINLNADGSILIEGGNGTISLAASGAFGYTGPAGGFSVTAAGVLSDNNGNLSVDIANSIVTINTNTFIIPSLPTVDPAVVGQVWNDSGTLKISI